MSYTHYSPFVVQSGMVPSPQSNFRALISVTDVRLKLTIHGGNVDNGNDIRPFSDAGLTTAMTYQKVFYDGTTGQLVMRVKVPTYNVGSTIYLGYGNPALTIDGSSASVFGSDVLLAYGLEDNAGTTAIVDATGSHNATNVANTSGKSTTGKVAKGLSFDGSTDAASVAINLSSKHVAVIVAWVNWTTNANNDKLVCEYTADYFSNEGFIVDWNNTDGGGGKMALGFTHSGSHWVDYFTRPSQGAFHRIVMIMDRSGPTNKAYVDGNLQSLTTILHDSATYGNFANSSLYLMSRATSSLNGAGILDEFYLLDAEPTADWVTSDWNSQNNPAACLPIGTEVSLGGAAYSRPFTPSAGTTINVVIRSTINNPDDVMNFKIGESGVPKIIVGFRPDGTISAFDGGSLGDVPLVDVFEADTNYALAIQWDSASRPNQYRVQVNLGEFSDWLETDGSYTAMDTAFIEDLCTISHGFFVDAIGVDIASPGPPSEDFNGYSAGIDLNGLSGGNRWTSPWTRVAGEILVDSSPSGMIGYAARSKVT